MKVDIEAIVRAQMAPLLPELSTREQELVRASIEGVLEGAVETVETVLGRLNALFAASTDGTVRVDDVRKALIP